MSQTLTATNPAAKPTSKFTWFPKDKTLNPVVASFIIGIHIIALFGIFTFSWSALAVCLGLHWVTGGLGITLGYHRLLTHRSFDAPKWFHYLLAIIGTLNLQSGPISWVTAHRVHHAKSDQEEDPHSPLRSFFWAHMGWCLYHNDCIENKEVHRRWSPDLMNDKGMVFIEKTQILYPALLGVALYAIGGWPFLIWGGFVRLVLVYHCTWLVNSAAHVWGYRTYKTTDQSTNNWWVALLSYGEGWHNNHHAFQYSARHGLRWWEVDTTYMAIKILSWLGIAKNIRIPSAKWLQSKNCPELATKL